MYAGSYGRSTCKFSFSPAMCSQDKLLDSSLRHKFFGQVYTKVLWHSSMVLLALNSMPLVKYFKLVLSSNVFLFQLGKKLRCCTDQNLYISAYVFCLVSLLHKTFHRCFPWSLKFCFKYSFSKYFRAGFISVFLCKCGVGLSLANLRLLITQF